MQIIGKKYLDDNFYDSIHITGDKIIVKSSVNTGTLDSTCKFTDSLVNKSKEEIISEIVDYFLRYSSVCFIGNGKVILANGRMLLFDSLHDIKLEKKIKDKYVSDRLNYLYEKSNDIYHVFVINRESFYGDENKYHLAQNDGVILNEELNFFADMIEYIFQNDIIYSRYVEGYSINHYEILTLQKNNKIIKLSTATMTNYYSQIHEIINKHNNNLKERKEVKQLKLEV